MFTEKNSFSISDMSVNTNINPQIRNTRLRNMETYNVKPWLSELGRIGKHGI